jgi:hypothetical protein
MCTGVGNCKTHQFLLRPVLWHWIMPRSKLITDCRLQTTTDGFYVTRAVVGGGDENLYLCNLLDIHYVLFIITCN